MSLIDTKRTLTIIQFELTRLFGSKRGIVTIAAFSCIWFIIYYYLISSAADLVSSPTFKDIAHQVFGRLELLEVFSWGIPQLSVYWLIAVILLPLFALLLACDQTCSDRERGTLRFILLRTTRSELLLGRFIGQTFILAILIGVTLVVSIVLALTNGLTVTTEQLGISLKVYGNLLIVVLPFVASMSLINSFVKSAKMSIVAYILLYVIGGIVINLIGYLLFDASLLFYLYPGEQIDRIITFNATSFDQLVLPIFQTFLYLLLANIVLKRASL